MANDKDFVVNGPVVVGKDTKVTVGTVTSGAVDLSTGNYFTDSPSGDYTYSFNNPGSVQAFQIEATGGSAAVASTFNTTLYTGTNATNSINNGLNLSTDGGLVWIKSRNANNTSYHQLYDTERGINIPLSSNGTGGQSTSANSLTAFNTTGFTLGSADASNSSVDNFVSWTFKEQTKFFDIVTYTGTGSAQNISHSLGSVPGMIIVKQTDATNNWMVQHIAFGGSHRLELNSTDSAGTTSSVWNNTDPTSTVFTVGAHTGTNASGGNYVAYLFAHDTASDGLIQCGSYTGNGASGNAVTLGWKPQFIIIKSSTGIRNWIMFDSARGMTTGNDPYLLPNTDGAEGTTTDWLDATATGFELQAENSVNASGENFIYMAIRSASAPAITWPTSIEWTQGTTPKTPAEGATDVYTFTTDDGGTTYTGIQSIDTAS